MKTELYLLCMFLFFPTVFLTIYSRNTPLSVGIWVLGFIMGGIFELLLDRD